MAKAFEGRAAIVTGASSGMGRLTAQRLARAGMECWLIGRSETELNVTCKSIADAGGPDAHIMPVDISAPGALADAVADVGGRHPYLAALINNAAVMLPDPVIDGSLDNSRAMMAINLMAPMEGCRAAVKIMRQHGKPAHLVNISSLASQGDGYGMYGISKAALNHLGKSLRHELEGDDIRVTTIIPGGFSTNLARSFPPEVLAQMQEKIGAMGVADMSRLMGDPDEIAKVIEYVLMQPININLEEIVVRPAVDLQIDY